MQAGRKHFGTRDDFYVLYIMQAAANTAATRRSPRCAAHFKIGHNRLTLLFARGNTLPHTRSLTNVSLTPIFNPFKNFYLT